VGADRGLRWAAAQTLARRLVSARNDAIEHVAARRNSSPSTTLVEMVSPSGNRPNSAITASVSLANDQSVSQGQTGTPDSSRQQRARPVPGWRGQDICDAALRKWPSRAAQRAIKTLRVGGLVVLNEGRVARKVGDHQGEPIGGGKIGGRLDGVVGAGRSVKGKAELRGRKTRGLAHGRHASGINRKVHHAILVGNADQLVR